MKSNIVFNLALIIMLAFFGACVNPANEKPTEDTPEDNPKPPAIEIKEPPAFCHQDHIVREGNYVLQIHTECAEHYIEKYAAYVDSIVAYFEALPDNPFPDIKRNLGYGAEVKNINELRNILIHENLKSYDELYTMMGNMSNDSTEIIFVLKDSAPGVEEPFMYFNFTYPCPTSCPR